MTRLVCPSDIGEVIKPFISLDRFDFDPRESTPFPLLPYSGIATLTILLSGDLGYGDAGDTLKHLEGGGVAWMRAGNGVWHGATRASGDCSAIRRVQSGRRAIPVEVALELADHVHDNALSSRKVDVLRLVAIGSSNKRIGLTPHVTEDTIKAHMKARGRSILSMLIEKFADKIARCWQECHRRSAASSPSHSIVPIFRGPRLTELQATISTAHRSTPSDSFGCPSCQSPSTN